MRFAALGAGVVASLAGAAIVAAVLPSVGLAQRPMPNPVTGSGGLIALATAAGEQRQQITLIDPETRVLSVYHIELSSGEVTLKSVRRIQWDLQLDNFNGTSPLPREVRSILDQK